ncbi:hypothetical protein CLV35_1354 [Motilibacter peucedani]|uniref:Uncharacterized protein n=1 Tax=Motilibacter peucedani TaxID=598650 RepID=A0A420XS58_9ACTN|nr:hypothetical protein [Motilibacter peucedani]RKS77660.1 hypothetical protein CLV35_1354 [Motilibacter peucedani]
MTEQDQTASTPADSLLAPQAVRDWEGAAPDEGDYAGEPATGGHLPASDAVAPGETYHGDSVRNEIQEITDIELSGETLTDEQRAVRRHGEEHVIDMEVRPDDRSAR